MSVPQARAAAAFVAPDRRGISFGLRVSASDSILVRPPHRLPQPLPSITPPRVMDGEDADDEATQTVQRLRTPSLAASRNAPARAPPHLRLGGGADADARPPLK
jgi:hypothetical protein